MSTQRAIIVGGGLGGLAAARAFQRKGIHVKLFEKAAAFLPTTGAGFGFSPNGQICVESLGLKDALTPILHPFRHHRVTAANNELLYDGDNLDQLAVESGYHIAGTLRADLVSLLANSLEKDTIHYKSNVTAIHQDETSVQVTLANGETIKGDFLVGADGINSVVARTVVDTMPDAPVYCGENIFYGILDTIPAFGQPEQLVQHLEAGEYIQYPVGPTKFVWAHVYKGEAPPDKSEWTGGSSPEASLRAFLSTLAPSHPLHAAAAITHPNQLLHFGMYYRKPKPSWHKGRVVLLGDACHATLPYIGQGANQAMEDAIVLADAIAKHGTKDVTAAFDVYFQKRFDRTKRIVDMAWYIGKFTHVDGWVGSFLRNAILKYSLTNGAMLKAALAEIVDHCPIPLPKIAK
ncbi:Aste57867_8272 [Aphanomyces stellatus]|uniref:Aste57867_8272 protein n=1 Tax=Aphanomyces stellatus TaxID=120398 RepID=A0A485KJU7_9STRA|nr:hypothetical protein As57867_008241 [Aphanomyces stellatus]VFT85159.1 Aste57867_8272 [Aphanomyces stellatus]